jgi:cytochrome c
MIERPYNMIRRTPRRSKMRIVPRACVTVLVLVLNSTFAFGAADPVAGQHDFAVRCASCHGTTVGQKKIGPTLAGVFGRGSGSVAGFDYSPALKKAHLTWNSTTLDKWLTSPSGLVHGTRMFANVPSSTDRKNLIAYLKTLKAGANASPAPSK